MRITKDTLLAAGDISGDLTSSSQQLDQIFGFSIQAIFTTSGSLGGILKLQASLDGVNFDDIANTSQTLSAAGSYTWNLADTNFPWVRVVYTHHSGDSGVLTVLFFGRGF